MMYANLAEYAAMAAGGLVLGTLFGSKVTGVLLALIHGLEGRMTAVERALSTEKTAAVAGTERHAAAIGAHAEAVAKLAEAIGKHAEAVDGHGAATVAAAVESHAATLVAAGKN